MFYVFPLILFWFTQIVLTPRHPQRTRIQRGTKKNLSLVGFDFLSSFSHSCNIPLHTPDHRIYRENCWTHKAKGEKEIFENNPIVEHTHRRTWFKEEKRFLYAVFSEMGDVIRLSCNSLTFCSSIVTAFSSSLNSFQPILPPNQRLRKGVVSVSDASSVIDSSSSIDFRPRKQLASFTVRTLLSWMKFLIWACILSPFLGYFQWLTQHRNQSGNFLWCFFFCAIYFWIFT